MRTTCCLIAVLLPALAAPADTLLLRSGGKVRGTVHEAVFLRQGKRVVYLHGQFDQITLNEAAPDTVRRTTGVVEKGELLSVRIKSVGGILTFKRTRLKSVFIGEAIPDKTRQEYLARRAALKDGDAAGLCELAAWCEKQGLKAEARDLASRALKADPAPEVAVQAHRMLGHVLRDGRWVKPGAPKEPEPEGPEQPEPEPPAKRAKAGPEQVRLARGLFTEYEQKSDEAKDQDRQAVKDFYREPWAKAHARIREAKKKYNKAVQRRDKLRDDIRAEKRRGEGGYPENPKSYTEVRRKERIDDLRREHDQVHSRLSRQEDEIARLEKERVRTALKIKAAKAKVSRRATKRGGRLTVARSKIERLLGLGHPLSEADMRAILEDALQD